MSYRSLSFGVTSVLLLWETALAAPRDPRCPRRAGPGRRDEPAGPPLPRCTAIVAAYLPNEQEIILETVTHLLRELAVPAGRLEVILAYNSPIPLPVEQTLAGEAQRDPRLRLLRVEGSRSKAENVNAALEVARGAIVGIFDADHQPEARCFHKAWRWLARGYDAVQGRCVIRNDTDSWLTRVVAIEFEGMYALLHLGRSLLTDTAIFCGSNGYWRTEVLRSLRLDPAMLTEDIDCSVRALLGGYRLLHDRSILSEELAPGGLAPWWTQRQRWAQGWLQVALKYWRAVLTTPRLSGGQKAFWLYTFLWLQVYPALSQQVLALVLAAQLLGVRIGWLEDWYVLATTALTLLCGPVVTFATYRQTPAAQRARLGWWFLAYTLGQPFYTVLKNWVALAAQQNALAHRDEWVVTTRTRARRAPVPALAPQALAPQALAPQALAPQALAPQALAPQPQPAA